MSVLDNGIFEHWVKEAEEEVSSKGWQECSVNALLLLCHAKTARRDNKIIQHIKGPIRFFVTTVAAGVIWFIVSGIIAI